MIFVYTRSLPFLCTGGTGLPSMSTRPFCSTRLFRNPRVNHTSVASLHRNEGQFVSSPKQMTRAFSGDAYMELDQLNDVFNADDAESHDRKRDALKIEYDFLLYTGEPVPSIVTDKMTQTLLEQPSADTRKKLWARFAANEEDKSIMDEVLKRRAAHRMKRIEKITRARLKDEYDGTLYDEHGVSVAGPPQCIVPKMDPTYVMKRQNLNFHYAMEFGQTLVLDLSLSADCVRRGSIRDMVKQVNALCRANRTLYEPFNIHICNFSEHSSAHGSLLEGTLSSGFSWNVSSQCFTSQFPKERILYLSPFAKNVWTKYRHDDVIVMGAYGKGESPDHSATVKKHKWRTARLNPPPYFVNRRPPNFHLESVI